MSHHRDPIDALRRADPIDGARLAASWSGSDAQRTLLEEIATMPADTIAHLGATTPADPTTPGTTTDHAEVGTAVGATASVRVPSRPSRSLGRPRRMAALAAALGVVALGLVIVPDLLTDNGPAAFAVRELPGGVIELDVTPGSADLADGRALAAELRELGIDVEVVTIPASPSMVGTVNLFQPGAGDYVPEGLRFGDDGTPEVFRWTIDPRRFRERLTVQIAVAAVAGEPYVLATSVFERGEVLGGLHCAVGHPVRAEHVATQLERLGVTPIWLAAQPQHDPSLLQTVPVDVAPRGEVIASRPVDATTVELTVRPDGLVLSADWDTALPDTPCTPGLAAAWR